PLGVSLTPTNGSTFNYGQSVALFAAPGGGTPPYNATFYTNGQPAGAMSSAPFSLNLGLLPPGVYSGYVHVTDSASPSGQADSAPNTFTIVPNPILLSLTAPTNGQSGFPGAALALSATASLNAPLTITNVELFYDGTLVAADSSAPYSASVG